MSAVEVTADPFAAAVEDFCKHALEFRGFSPQTVYGYRRDLVNFGAWLSERLGCAVEPRQVTRNLVIAHVEGMTCGGCGKRQRLACIGSLFGYLTLIGKVGQSPVHGIPLPKKADVMPRSMNLADVDKLLAAADGSFNRAALTVMLKTGIRLGEFVGLRLSDIDFDARAMRVRGKGNKERIAPLAEDVAQALAEWLRFRPDAPTDHVFTCYPGRALKAGAIYQRIRRLAERAGIAARVSPHRLRHTFATSLVRRNVDIRTVQELMGHADLSTTGRYLSADTEAKHAAVATLDGIGRALDARPVNPQQIAGTGWGYEATATMGSAR